MIIDEEVYLEHFGVKGMHWGVRNAISNVQRGHQLNKDFRAKTKADKKAKAASDLAKARKQFAPPKTTKTFDKSTPEGRFAAKQYRRAQIDRARVRINSGALAADYKDTKKQYKQDKMSMGRSHAKAIFKDKKKALNADIDTAQQIRDGKELTGHIIGTLGTAALAGANVRA